ncbi:phosphodiester glycosidase family protein [Streptomyces sp. NPDC007369]|uniref:phosphodiester glycosidase family protein n=1 Tax=Streptomyces sp. NPDC007369 TaxID=3154589 RepID=UPI003405B778
MPNAVRPLLTALVVPVLACGAGPARAAGADAEDGLEIARAVRQVAPGVRLESYDRLESDRWLRIDELVVELGEGGSGVRAEYLGGRGAATVARAAAVHPAGPGRRVVAAANGDFFDARGTGAPLGPGVAAGRLLHSAGAGSGPARAVAFGADATGRVQRIGLDGRITFPGGAVRPLAGYNAARPPDGFAAYTADWPGAALPAVSATVTVRDGRVTADAPARARLAERPERRRRPGRPAPGTTLLTATGTAAVTELAALRPGDAVAVTARPLPKAGPAPVTAVGGREPLVVAGVPQNHDGKANNTAAPRTAVGFSRDGRQMRILTVDGRQRDSGGLTLTGLGRLMHRNGAHEALNLDGGGSSTLLAARAGAAAPTLENAPSDGFPRRVANGLVLTAPTGSGRPAGYRVEPAAGSTEDHAEDPAEDPALTRVLSGLTRTLTATGYDRALGPAAGEPAWSAEGSGTVSPAGVFRAATRPGSATVHARRAQAHGALRLEVLGPLTRIRPTRARIGLAERGESTGFRLLGQDAQGASAVVEPRDVALQFDRSQWSVKDDGRGGFTVTALTPRATGTLRVTPRPAPGPPERDSAAPGRTGSNAAAPGRAGLDSAHPWRDGSDLAGPGRGGSDLAGPGRGGSGAAGPVRGGPGAAAPGRDGLGAAGPGHRGSAFAGPKHGGSDAAGPGRDGSGAAGPGRDGPGAVRPVRGGLGAAGLGRGGLGAAGLGRGGLGAAGPGRDGLGAAGPGRDGLGAAGPVRGGSGAAGLGYGGSGAAGLGRDGSGSAGLGYGGSGAAGLGRDGSGSAGPGYGGSGAAGPGRGGSGAAGPGRGGLGAAGPGRDGPGAVRPVRGGKGAAGPERGGSGSAGAGRGGAGAVAVRSAAGQPPAGAAVGAEIALGVGLATQPLAGLDDAAAWTGPGAGPADGHRGRGLALALPGPARRRSAAPPRPLPVPELARSLTLWVCGDGSGARPAVELTDADGAAVSVPGPAADWTGWRELTLPLPVTAQRPLTVTRLSAVAAARPARLLLDTLGARTPPTGRVAEPAAARDPILAGEAAVRARPWRFAVEPAAPTQPRTAVDAALRADLVLTGAARAPFVHRGVRFLTLDTARRTLAGGGLSRLHALRTALAAAAEEPDTGALAVVQRHAPQTVDRKEAALTARLLAEFRRTTGKRAALFTVGAPAFDVGRAEGVPAVAVPAAAGRVLVGVDAFAAGDWLSVREKTG